MKENALIDKSIAFAARIVKLHRYLIKDKKETIISKQIVRSGTSIGANINEANNDIYLVQTCYKTPTTFVVGIFIWLQSFVKRLLKRSGHSVRRWDDASILATVSFFSTYLV